MKKVYLLFICLVFISSCNDDLVMERNDILSTNNIEISIHDSLLMNKDLVLKKDLAKALSKAEHILLVDIYAAREKDPGDISSRTLQEEIKKHGKDALYFPSFEEAEKYLSEKCIDGDLLITMGAGNVVEIGEHLVQK